MPFTQGHSKCPPLCSIPEEVRAKPNCFVYEPIRRTGLRTKFEVSHREPYAVVFCLTVSGPAASCMTFVQKLHWFQNMAPSVASSDGNLFSLFREI